jgi:phospholipid transport system substrate-binding protein
MNSENSTMLSRRQWMGVVGLAPWVANTAWAADEAPDALIKRISSEVMNAVNNDAAIQKGSVQRVMDLVNNQIMPHVNFQRMTASAVGRYWRGATPDQQQRLQAEFKTLLVRTYAGALGELKGQTFHFRPLRARPTDTEVVVRSEVRGRGEPIQLDYRMEKTPQGWKVYDLNVLGVWLGETYRTQFAQEITKNGVDGLITFLAQRNQSNAAASK